MSVTIPAGTTIEVGKGRRFSLRRAVEVGAIDVKPLSADRLGRRRLSIGFDVSPESARTIAALVAEHRRMLDLRGQARRKGRPGWKRMHVEHAHRVEFSPPFSPPP